MYFCFEAFLANTCARNLLGTTPSPEECCFSTDRGGLGGGSYVASGDEECFSCMNIIGEEDFS